MEIREGKLGPRGRWLVPALLAPFAGAVALWLAVGPTPSTRSRFFAERFPAGEAPRREIAFLRETGKLSDEDERLILHASVQTARILRIPPAILWCLLFQESRLDHLLGVSGNRPSYGLGQFTHYAFYEINYQLQRFDERHREALVRLLGADVRPIGPDAENRGSPSSYFSIPTAVVTTGLYLKNRYLHLTGVLADQSYDFSPHILWLHATMAYNKGTRGVLTYWNTVRRLHGESRLQRLLTDERTFFEETASPRTFEAGFARIWPRERAGRYARELSIHLAQIAACACEQSPQVTGEEAAR